MGKLIDYQLRRVQVTCPNCKYEFPHNKAALDKRINLLGEKYHELNKLKEKISRIPKDQRNQKEYERVKKELDNCKQLIADYKLERETLKEQEDRLIFENLKMLLRERYGDEAYKQLLDEALRQSSAYDTESMMGIGYYSHAGGKRIRKV